MRHNKDENLINGFINNIIKSKIRKIKKFEYCNANTLLLLSPNLEIKSKRYIFCKNKSNKNFIFNVILKKYIKEDTIQVEIKVNYDNLITLKKNEIISIFIDCVRVIDDFDFNFYLNYFGEKFDNEELKNWYNLNPNEITLN